jgi:hypothetical protein
MDFVDLLAHSLSGNLELSRCGRGTAEEILGCRSRDIMGRTHRLRLVDVDRENARFRALGGIYCGMKFWMS